MVRVDTRSHVFLTRRSARVMGLVLVMLSVGTIAVRGWGLVGGSSAVGPILDWLGLLTAAVGAWAGAVLLSSARREEDALRHCSGRPGHDLPALREGMEQTFAALESYSAVWGIIRGQLAGVAEITEEAAQEIVTRLRHLDQLVGEMTEKIRAAMEEIEALSARTQENRTRDLEVLQNVQEYLTKRQEEMGREWARVDHVLGEAESLKTLIGITDLVKDIADQMNVLALNATIEAARVGQAGKGFAVVATEIRALSQKSAEAAKRIEKGISEIVQSLKTLFGHQLDPANRRRDSEILTEVGAALGTVGGTITEIPSVIQDAVAATQRVNDKVAQMILESLASIQFQDITRQRLEHAVEVLEQMDRHSHLLLARSKEGTPVVVPPLDPVEIASRYTMHGQRIIHRRVEGTEDEISEDEGPQIELF